jgi:hypothetical protein
MYSKAEPKQDFRLMGLTLQIYFTGLTSLAVLTELTAVNHLLDKVK